MKKHNKIILGTSESWTSLSQRLRNFVDFSKFPENHVLYNNNNQECGKMKSERKGKIINYAISLRSKMYYLDTLDKKNQGNYLCTKR